MEESNFVFTRNLIFGALEEGTTKVSEAHNSKILASLTDEQRKKIVQLRDLIPVESKTRWPVASEDMTLYRFLQARKWVVKDAWPMLEDHLVWREEYVSYP